MNRRFRPIIGPGFIIALALAGLYLWWRAQPPNVARPVVVQHEGAMAATGVPDPPFVLDHARELGITTAQAPRLRKLAAAYLEETSAVRKALDEAAREMGSDFSRSVGESASLTEVPERSHTVAELSGLLAEARAAAWPGLCAVLSAEQQQRAKRLWAEAHTLRAPSKGGDDRGG